MARRPKLVTQYLEKIHRSAFAKHPDIIRELVRKRNGIYALYSKDELYYVGLATDLRWRLKHHLKYKPKDSWDRFSMYLTIGSQHLRELEALAIRITLAAGNIQKGRISGAENLAKPFRRALHQKHRRDLDFLMGSPVPDREEPKASRRMLRLRGTYKGKKFKARMRADGAVKHGKKLYTSLSAAASAVCGHQTNGRWFWRFERSPGDWVRMKSR